MIFFTIFQETYNPNNWVGLKSISTQSMNTPKFGVIIVELST